jgi:hypothetical protein
VHTATDLSAMSCMAGAQKADVPPVLHLQLALGFGLAVALDPAAIPTAAHAAALALALGLAFGSKLFTLIAAFL